MVSLSHYLVFNTERDVSVNFETQKWLLEVEGYERLREDIRGTTTLQVYGLYGDPEHARQVASQLLQVGIKPSPANSFDQIIVWYKPGGSRLCLYFQPVNPSLFTHKPFPQGTREVIYPRLLLDLAPTMICCPPAPVLSSVYISADARLAHPFISIAHKPKRIQFKSIDVKQTEFKEVKVNFEEFKPIAEFIVSKDAGKYVFLIETIEVNRRPEKDNEDKQLSALITEISRKVVTKGNLTVSDYEKLPVFQQYLVTLSSLYTHHKSAITVLIDHVTEVVTSLHSVFLTQFYSALFNEIEGKFELNRLVFEDWKNSIVRKSREMEYVELYTEQLRDSIERVKDDEFADTSQIYPELNAIVNRIEKRMKNEIPVWVEGKMKEVPGKMEKELRNYGKNLRELTVNLRPGVISQESETLHIKLCPHKHTYSFPTPITHTDLTLIGENEGYVTFHLTGNRSEMHRFNPLSSSRYDNDAAAVQRHIAIVPGSTARTFIAYQPDTHYAYWGTLNEGGSVNSGTELRLYTESVREIIASVYLQRKQVLYVVNQEGGLFTMDLRDEDENQEPMEVMGNSGLGKEMTEMKPLRSESLEPFKDVHSSEDEDTLFLLTNSHIEIYDKSYTKQVSIPVTPTTVMKVLREEYRNYILLYTPGLGFKAYQHVGVGTYQVLVTEKLMQGNIQGNPIIDILGYSVRKFGSESLPNSQFYLSSPNSDDCEGLLDYTKSIPELKPLFSSRISILREAIPASEPQLTEKVMFRMRTLQPIHICSIQDGNLMPLQQGRSKISDFRNALKVESEDSLIEKIVSFMNIGHFEGVLEESREKPLVVSIMGKQSSGKSYLMNQLFGCRYDVASSRCTDGIWLSVNRVEGRLVVVLDCEGLFSQERTEQEEMKLCLYVSSLSDVTIINSDMNFSKHLIDFLTKFSNAASRLHGERLFQGVLYIVIRDVSQDFNSLVNCPFIAPIFSNTIRRVSLHHYQQPSFPSEIQALRTSILTRSSHWDSGSDLLEWIKVVLAQVYADDIIPVEGRVLLTRLKDAKKRAIQKLKTGANISQCLNENREIAVRVNINGVFTVNWRIEDAHLNGNLSLDFFVNKIKENVDLVDFVKRHKEVFVAVGNMAMEHYKELLSQLKRKISSKYSENHPEYALIQDQCNLLDQELQFLFEKLTLCGKKCSDCNLKCLLSSKHGTECDCKSDHSCKENCEICENTVCGLRAGHQSDHLCSTKQHTCQSKCELCDKECALRYHHQGSHSCGLTHPCGSRCAVWKHCDGLCVIDKAEAHEVHTCGRNGCPVRCIMTDCMLYCDSEDHMHSLREGQRHQCDQQHKCYQPCSAKGICSVAYVNVNQQWGKNGSTELVKIHGNHDTCILSIPARQPLHVGSHKCGAKKHQCDKQCPDCECFCELEPDHKGLHLSHAHRNKTKCIYIRKKGDLLAGNGGKKTGADLAVPGEKASSEYCHKSCERKGRGHYHPLECTGGSRCLQSVYRGKALHMSVQMEGSSNTQWDMCECRTYYAHFQWQAPIETLQGVRAQDQFSFCPFFCIEPHESRVYCDYLLFHSMSNQRKEHMFTCRHPSSEVFDVCFTLDCTGSMGWCFEKVIQILKSVLYQKNGLDIKFAIVAYTDHDGCGMMPSEAHPYLIYPSNGSLLSYNEAEMVAFLSSLRAGGGGCNYGEAAIDGLYHTSTLGFRPGSQRIVYLIGDDTAQGSEFDSGTKYPNGCPCGYNWRTILSSLRSQNTLLKVVNLNPVMNQLCDLFKQEYGRGFEVVGLNDLAKFTPAVTNSIVQTIDYCLEYRVG